MVWVSIIDQFAELLNSQPVFRHAWAKGGQLTLIIRLIPMPVIRPAAMAGACGRQRGRWVSVTIASVAWSMHFLLRGMYGWD